MVFGIAKAPAVLSSRWALFAAFFKETSCPLIRNLLEGKVLRQHVASKALTYINQKLVSWYTSATTIPQG